MHHPNGSLHVTGAPSTPVISGAPLVCAGDVESYTASAQGATSFTWVMDPLEGTIIPTANPNEILVDWATNGGSIHVTASNSCGASAQGSVIVGSACRVAGGDPDAELLASVFPNPSKGLLTLQIHVADKTSYVVKVKDVTGRLAYSKNVTAEPGLNRFEIDITSLAKGMYNLSVESAEGNTLVFKVITE